MFAVADTVTFIDKILSIYILMIGKLHRTPITIWYAHYSEKSYDGYIINLWTKIGNSKNASFSIDYGEFKSQLIFVIVSSAD